MFYRLQIMPCFKGAMWTGDVCCAYSIHPVELTPEMDDLAFQPDPGCNSASVQYIYQVRTMDR